MPIEIVGLNAGSERNAAEALKAMLRPHMNQSSRVVIVVGAKCIGGDIQDIDLLVLGTFGSGIEIGQPGEQSIKLVNLALIIEIKDQSDERVCISSQHVSVQYSSGWEDVTEKAFRQAKALPRFLKANDLKSPWFESIVWLPNYTRELPSSLMNVLGSDANAGRLFAAINRIKPPKDGEQGPYISFTTNLTITELQRFQEMRSFFNQTIPHTRIDRKRIEAISKRLIDGQKYAERLGSQLLVFRGRAGSGKTIHLLRLAKDLYDVGERVLFLTFNKALVADVRRLLMIMNIDDLIERGVHISTAHKFFVDMLKAWDYWKPPSEQEQFPTRAYEIGKKDLLTLLSGETPQSLKGESLFKNNPDVFGWDYVLIDEAQDWPGNERDILYATFGPERVIIADGVDQLLRNEETMRLDSIFHQETDCALKKSAPNGIELMSIHCGVRPPIRNRVEPRVK